MENCNDCRHINMTEEQQINKREHHKCLRYNVKLLHRSNDPRIEHNYIYPHVKCGGKNFERR